MSDRPVLNVRPRTVLGKKVATLRRQGVLPANVYGRTTESVAVETDAREFGRFLRSRSVRGVFDLSVEGEPTPRPVILRALTRKGGTGEPIHVDFFQVDVERPVVTSLPLRLIGESPAVRDLAGTLVQSLETVKIKSLPLDIPDLLDVDLGLLTTYTSTVTVADLASATGVTMLTPMSMVIVAVTPPRVRRT